MNVEPAHVDQVRAASDGRMVLIDSDVCGVAADLRAIDPGLKVRFAEGGNPPFFAVYHESYAPNGDLTQQLVLTQKAHLTHAGTWAGLDQSIVDRVREIDSQGRSGYDFVAELEKQNSRARKAERDAFRERMGDVGQRAAHAARKDLGSTSRAFISSKYD